MRRGAALSEKMRLRWAAVLSAMLAICAAPAGHAAASHGEAQTPTSTDTAPNWWLVPMSSHSTLTGERADWDAVSLQLLRRIRPGLLLGAHIDRQHRPPETDVGYGGSFSWYPTRSLELRSGVSVVPRADFLPRQTYTTGLEWRAARHMSMALDYKRLNFPDGAINMWTPALTYWFSDRTWLTGRHTVGRAFGEQNFRAYTLMLNLGMPRDARLTLAFAHGDEAEKDPGVPNVIVTTATTSAAYYRLPVRHNLDLIVGAEYEVRMDLYRRTTGTIGFVARF
jgi:YaiO family outer membrane protein